MANESAIGIQTFPYEDWMTRLYDRFKDQQLGDIVIPGTHDSGCFKPLLPTAQTQDRDLGEQLEAGIRYFDIRVLWTDDKWRPGLEKNTFYLVHSKSTAPGMELEPQLKKIARFAAAHPREIIILEVGGPVAFDDGMPAHVKQELVDLIAKTLRNRASSQIFRYSAHHNPASCASVSQIRVSSAANAGQNIILISGAEPSPSWSWPQSDSIGSWRYTTYLSDALLTVADRLNGSDIPIRDSTDTPRRPFTEEEFRTPAESFRETLTKLLLRRDEESRRHDPEETPPYQGVQVPDNPREYIDLSRRLFKLEFAFSTLTILTSAPDVNKAAVEWIREWEKGVSGYGPSGQVANTRGQTNVIALDYYNRVGGFMTETDTFMEAVVEMNANRFPAWSSRGRLAAGFKSVPAPSLNKDGRPEVLAVGRDNKLWTNYVRHIGGWSGWTILHEIIENKPLSGGKLTKRIAAGWNEDGRIEVFTTEDGNYMWHIWQTSPGGGWSDWQYLKRPTTDFEAADMAVGSNQDGRLELYVINRRDRHLWHIWQMHPNSSWFDHWEDMGNPTGDPLDRVVAKRDASGRLEVILVSVGKLWHTRQTGPNNGWTKGWEPLGAPVNTALTIIDVGHNRDGRLEVFVLAENHVWTTWQEGTEGKWAGRWQNLGAPSEGLTEKCIVQGNYQDGRLVVFAATRRPELWQVSQEKPNGGWGPWSFVKADPPSGRISQLQIGRTKFGSPLLFAVDEDSTLWTWGA